MAERLSKGGVFAQAEMVNKAKELIAEAENQEGRDKSVPI